MGASWQTGRVHRAPSRAFRSRRARHRTAAGRRGRGSEAPEWRRSTRQVRPRRQREVRGQAAVARRALGRIDDEVQRHSSAVQVVIWVSEPPSSRRRAKASKQATKRSIQTSSATRCTIGGRDRLSRCHRPSSVGVSEGDGRSPKTRGHPGLSGEPGPAYNRAKSRLTGDGVPVMPSRWQTVLRQTSGIGSDTPTVLAESDAPRQGVNGSSAPWPKGTLFGLPSTGPYGVREARRPLTSPSRWWRR